MPGGREVPELAGHGGPDVVADPPRKLVRPDALHQGQASSGGAARDDFIAYHGVRNVIWMHVKLMPTALLWPRPISVSCATAS